MNRYQHWRTTYESTLKVSDIDGSNFAQTILHRHSTTKEPLVILARSNSDTTSHAGLRMDGRWISLLVGTAGTNYKVFGQIRVAADDTGTISDTSSPAKMIFGVTPMEP